MAGKKAMTNVNNNESNNATAGSTGASAAAQTAVQSTSSTQGTTSQSEQVTQVNQAAGSAAQTAGTDATQTDASGTGSNADNAGTGTTDSASTGSTSTSNAEGVFSYDAYLASLPPMSYPLYTTPDGGQHEAEFTFCAIGRVTDVLFTKAKSGSKQVWVRGCIVRDVVTPPEKMTAEQRAVNPEGFNAFSCRPGPEEGTFEGYRSVVGFPFIYAGTLADGSAVEMLANNLRAFGWTGKSWTDFVGKEGKSVLARDLGMDGEIEMHFKYSEAKGNFAGKIQLNKLVPISASVSMTDAESADAMYEDVLYASLNGRVDGRNKSYQGAAARMKAAMGQSTAPGRIIDAPRGPSFKPTQQRTAAGQEKVPGQPGNTTGGSGRTAQNSAQVNQAHCGKPVNGGRACSKAPGHAGACGLMPFG